MKTIKNLCLLALLSGIIFSPLSEARLKRDLSKLDLKEANQKVVLSYGGLGAIFGNESGTGTPIVAQFSGGVYYSENFYLGIESAFGKATGVTSAKEPWLILSGGNLAYESRFGSSSWVWNVRSFLGFAYTRNIATQEMPIDMHCHTNDACCFEH